MNGFASLNGWHHRGVLGLSDMSIRVFLPVYMFGSLGFWRRGIGSGAGLLAGIRMRGTQSETFPLPPLSLCSLWREWEWECRATLGALGPDQTGRDVPESKEACSDGEKAPY